MAVGEIIVVLLFSVVMIAVRGAMKIVRPIMDLGDILTRLDMTVQTLNRSVQVLESMQRETEKRVSRLEVDVGILKGQVDEKNN